MQSRINYFSTQVAPDSEQRSEVEVEVPPMTLEELQSKIDMDELRQFNPKLHAEIEKNPEILLDL